MTMNAKKKYKQMVIYIEACESGSMFAKGLLPDDINSKHPHTQKYDTSMG